MSTRRTIFEGTVDEIIATMREITGAKSDAELAGMLDLQRSAIAQWKKRQSVPEKAKRKADHIAFAQERSNRATVWAASLPAEIAGYARALAVAYLAPLGLRDLPEDTQKQVAERLYQEVLFFDEVAAACALRITQRTQMSDHPTPREVYSKLLFDPYFKHDIFEMFTSGALHVLRRTNEK
jgi:hypothetical protein